MGGSCDEYQPITAADATSPNLPSEPKSPKRNIAAYFWAVPCLCLCGVPYRCTRSAPPPPYPALAQSVPKTPRFFLHLYTHKSFLTSSPPPSAVITPVSAERTNAADATTYSTPISSERAKTTDAFAAATQTSPCRKNGAAGGRPRRLATAARR
jgi:hypothetical protein